MKVGEFHIGIVVEADGGGEGMEVEAGGSNRQDSRRCRSEYHSVQKAGDDGFLAWSLLWGGVGIENTP